MVCSILGTAIAAKQPKGHKALLLGPEAKALFRPLAPAADSILAACATTLRKLRRGKTTHLVVGNESEPPHRRQTPFRFPFFFLFNGNKAVCG